MQGYVSCRNLSMSSQFLPTTNGSISEKVVRPPRETTKSTIAFVHTASVSTRVPSRSKKNAAGFISSQAPFPQHFLYFFPDPHGHGSLRPILGSSRTVGFSGTSSPSLNFQPSFSFTNTERSWWLQNSPFAV